MPCIRNVGGVRPHHFLYMPAVSNVLTNGTVTINGFKMEPCASVCLVSSLPSMVHCSESKPILYLDIVYCKFYSMQA